MMKKITIKKALAIIAFIFIGSTTFAQIINSTGLPGDDLIFYEDMQYYRAHPAASVSGFQAKVTTATTAPAGNGTIPATGLLAGEIGYTRPANTYPLVQTTTNKSARIVSSDASLNFETDVWLVANSVDLSAYDGAGTKYFTFSTLSQYREDGSTNLDDDNKIFYSTNFVTDTDPTAGAVWTEITTTTPVGASAVMGADGVWTTQSVDLSAITCGTQFAIAIRRQASVNGPNNGVYSATNKNGTFWMSDLAYTGTSSPPVLEDVSAGAFSALNISATGQTNIFNTPSASISNVNFTNTGAWANVLTTTNSTPRLAQSLIPIDEGYKFEVSSGYNPIVVSEVRFIESNGHDTKGSPSNSMWKVQGSNDDTNWDDLSSPIEMVSTLHTVETTVPLTTSQPYRYYRFVLITAWTPNQAYTALNQLDFTVAILEDVDNGDFTALNTSSTGQTNIFKTPIASISNANFTNSGAWSNVLTTTNSTPRLAQSLIPIDEGYKFEVSSGYNSVIISEVRFIESNGHDTKGAPGNSMWKVQGSNDDANWDDLSSPIEMASTLHTVETTVPLTTSQPYRYYRFVLATAWTPNQAYTALNQLDFTVGLPNNWTGATDTDWSTASNWSKGEVPSGEDISIPTGLTNYPTATASVTANSITIEPGASFSVQASLTGDVILESVSNAYSSLIVDGTVTGTVNYKRYVNEIGTTNANNNGNDLISAPVTGQQFNTFASANTNLATSGSTAAFAPFDNTASSPGAYVNYNTGATTTLAPGRGYRAATDNGSPLTFTGTVNSGTVTTPITIGTGSEWNLIGNPYPSYLKVNDGVNGFLNNTANAGLLDENSVGIYGYDANPAGTGVWTIYNLTNTTASTLIVPGQGFFVAAQSGGNIEFTSIMRSTGTTDDFIAGRTANETNALSKLKVTNATDTYITDIYFIDGRSRGLDPGYDARAFQGNADGIFTHLVDNNSGIEMAIQALPYNDFNDAVVPLGIKAEAGIELNIGIDELSTLASNINVYLEDNVANTFTLLNDGDYTYTPSAALNDTGRFFVHYSSTTLSLQDSEFNGLQIYSSQSPKALFVNGQLTKASTANLYDIQGRLVLSKKLDQYSNSNKIDISTISTGIYIIKVDNGNRVKTQKVIIK